MINLTTCDGFPFVLGEPAYCAFCEKPVQYKIKEKKPVFAFCCPHCGKVINEPKVYVWEVIEKRTSNGIQYKIEKDKDTERYKASLWKPGYSDSKCFDNKPQAQNRCLAWDAIQENLQKMKTVVGL